MKVGELKKMLENINDDVRIDCIINTEDPEDGVYDIDAFLEIMHLDTANTDGYVEFLMSKYKL